MSQDGARIMRRLDELAAISGDPKCLTRTFLSSEHRRANELVRGWMREGGMEASIERVGVEIRHAHPIVAEELMRTAHEMQVNADTRTALVNFGARTGLDSARRFATVLSQSMQYGTPLTQALRSLSAEQRQEMLARFEAKAGRLPVLLTLPMIIFILPCVFLIVAGPAMVDVYRTMTK